LFSFEKIKMEGNHMGTYGLNTRLAPPS